MSSEPVVSEPVYSNVRRWPRYKLDLPVRVIAQKPGKTVIVQGRGNELNEGGLAVFAGIELTLGEQVAVEFTPPYSGEPLRARGTVRNRTGYTYGLEFLTETAEDLENARDIRAVLRGMAQAVK